jgi:hypothetical protein
MEACGNDNEIFPKIEKIPKQKTMNLAGNGVLSEE